MKKQHANHGRDHLPTGMDPIPGLFTGGGGEASFAYFTEFATITVHSGSSQVAAWDVLISTTNDASTFDVTAGHDLSILQTGSYVIEFYTSVDSSTTSDLRNEIVSWDAATRFVGMHKRWKTGQPDTEAGQHGLWAIPSSATPPFTLPLQVVYTASGTGAFAMGIGGMIMRLDT